MEFYNLEEHMNGIKNEHLAARSTYVISEGKYDTIIHHLNNPTVSVSAHFKAWVKKKKFSILNIPELNVVNSLVIPADEKNNLTGFDCKKVVHAERMFEIVLDMHCHETQHGGYKKTLNQVQRLYYGIPRKYVQEFTKNCPVCQLSVSQKVRPPPPLRAIIFKGFLQRVQVDLIDMRHDPDSDYKWIGHFMDHFSKFHVIFPLRSKTAQEVAEMLQQRVLSYLGVPRIFHSNNGREFVNQLLEALIDQWGGDVIFVRGHPRHSQSQEMVENGNKTLQTRLAAIKAEQGTNSQTPWASWLPRIQYELNTTVQESGKQSPYTIVFSQPPQSSLVPVSSVRIVDEEDVSDETTKADTISLSPELVPRTNQPPEQSPPSTTQLPEPMTQESQHNKIREVAKNNYEENAETMRGKKRKKNSRH